MVQRTGDQHAAEKLTDQDLLREVMNTVGKEGRLGGDVRCVVSVAMLTEGWDASTVTHVLGVRAFGTQLLCEQVIGRALRRQSYDLNEDGLFNVEYADVLGIPFDFTAKRVQTTYVTRRDSSKAGGVRTVATADYRVTIANATDSTATVDVLEERGGEWSVLSSSVPAEKLSSTRTRFRAKVPARSEAAITYRVRIVW